MIRRLFIVALVLCAAGVTLAQTPTQTHTPTPTTTPTPTLGKRVGMLMWRETCTSPPCDGADLYPDRGSSDNDDIGSTTKTVFAQVESGTATVQFICRPNPQATPIVVASLSGATCTTAANCRATITGRCNDLFPRISACSSCVGVSAWAQD